MLLKNDGLLPLRPDARIAVVGLLADECKLDWYSGTLIHRSTPLECLYEVLVGASSEDIRLRTTVGLDREPGAPRPVRERGLNAADFDEQRGIALVDRTKAAGDAVTPVDGGTAELIYQDCDFGTHEGVTGVTVEAAGEGVVELSLDGGPLIAVLTLDATKGPYDYTTLGAEIVAAGTHDVHLRLRGPLRLAHIGFSG